MQFILGKKIGMTRIYDPKGRATPVTLVEVRPCLVTAMRTLKKDGYFAIQVAIPGKEHPKVSQGHPRKKDDFCFRREFKVSEEEGKKYKVGDAIDVTIFSAGDTVDVRGTSKGKGFQGVVKRWGFKGGPASHGHRHDQRAPGSIGSAFPEKVFKGMKMAGRMGGGRVTAGGLKVLGVEKKLGVLALKGALPGPNGGYLAIKSRGQED